MPVGEILRRLQAFEDAQARRLETYSAKNALVATLPGQWWYRCGRGNVPGRLLLPPGRRIRLGMAGPARQRRALAQPEDPPDPPAPAREGERPSRRDHLHQGLRLPPARHRSRRRTRLLGGRLRAGQRGRAGTVALPGHRVDRPEDLRPRALPDPAAGPARRRGLERRDDLLHAGRRRRPARRVDRGELLPADPHRRAADLLAAQRRRRHRAGALAHGAPHQPS